VPFPVHVRDGRTERFRDHVRSSKRATQGAVTIDVKRTGVPVPLGHRIRHVTSGRQGWILGRDDVGTTHMGPVYLVLTDVGQRVWWKQERCEVFVEASSPAEKGNEVPRPVRGLAELLGDAEMSAHERITKLREEGKLKP